MTPDSLKPERHPALAGIRPLLIWEVLSRLEVTPAEAAQKMGVSEEEAARQLADAHGRNCLRLVWADHAGADGDPVSGEDDGLRSNWLTRFPRRKDRR